LPTELDNGTVFVYQDDSIVSVERKNSQLKLECNLKYDLCILELAGWYYGKTAGLFGTMNNEQIDDFLTSDGRMEHEVGRFAHSWSLETDKCTSSENLAMRSSSETKTNFCRELFTNKSSEFSACFGIVDSDAYRFMCANSANEREACGVAMSYLQTCMFHDTYLRIPNDCTACGMNEPGISQIPEGDFLRLEGKFFQCLSSNSF
jgi:hypothetical protein